MKEIEAYLGNTLTPTEKTAFEKRMQQDPALEKAVKAALEDLATAYIERELPKTKKKNFDEQKVANPFFQQAYQQAEKLEKDTNTMIELQQWLDTKERVQQIFEENREDLQKIYNPESQVLEGKVKSMRWLKPALYLAAACIALLLALNIGINSYSSTSLSKEYFGKTNTPDAGITLGVDKQEEGRLQFDNGEYEQAIKSFSTITDTSDAYPFSRFLTAYAYMQLNETDQAISIYEEILEAENNRDSSFFPYIDRSRWFLSIAYLDRDQAQKAKTLLEEIAKDEDHYMHTRAQQLLADLNHFFRGF